MILHQNWINMDYKNHENIKKILIEELNSSIFARFLFDNFVDIFRYGKVGS